MSCSFSCQPNNRHPPTHSRSTVSGSLCVWHFHYNATPHTHTHRQAHKVLENREGKGDEGRPSGDFFPHVSPTLAEVVTMSGSVFSACFLSAFRSGHVRQTCPVPHTHVQLWLVSVPSARPPFYGATVPLPLADNCFGFIWECACECAWVCVVSVRDSGVG